MKNVFITIKGTADAGNGDDIVELSSEGIMEYSPDKTVLHYNEGEGIGVKDVKTVLTLTSEGFVMERSGGLSTRLEVMAERRSNTVYATAYGEFNVGVKGEMLQNNLGPDGGKFVMKYTLDQNLQIISRNKIEITVKEI